VVPAGTHELHGIPETAQETAPNHESSGTNHLGTETLTQGGGVIPGEESIPPERGDRIHPDGHEREVCHLQKEFGHGEAMIGQRD